MSTIFNEYAYWNANVRGTLWYDLSLVPEDIIRKVSTILYCADSTNWIIVIGNKSTLNAIRAWAKLTRHCFRYSVNKKLCAIKCADASGIWRKWIEVPELAGLLKKAYDEGDIRVSIRYVSKDLVKTKLKYA